MVSLVLLALLAARFEGEDLLLQADLGLLGIALAISLTLVTTVGAWKWWRVIRLGGMDLGFGTVWRMWNGLLAITFFAPFQSGHLLYAVALRKAADVSAFEAAESVAYDKWLSLVGTFVLIGLGQVLLPEGHDLRHPLILLAAVGVLAVALADQWVVRLAGRFRFVRERSRFLERPVPWRDKLILLGVATVYQASDAISFTFACVALGATIDPLTAFAAFPVILLLTYVPVSFSGFGVREGLVVVLLSDSLDFDRAVGAGVLVDFLEYIAPALFGLVGVSATLPLLSWRRRRRDPEADGT